MEKDAKIYVAGHQGLVGSALMRALIERGYHNLILSPFSCLDLRNQHAVNLFFEQKRPEYIFLAAARVGGIKANSEQPAEFIYDNLMISANVIQAAYRYNVKKMIFLGSSCIYPRNCPQPITEDYLLTDVLEKSNESYAIAKIAGIKLCQAYNAQYGTNFITCMPTNVYGPYDNFDLNSCHVLPALIAKCYAAQKEAKEIVEVWGTGTVYREFIYVEDLAEALIFLMNIYNDNEPINIGTGTDLTIHDLAQLIAHIIGFKGKLIFDLTKPEGTPRKLLDVSKLHALGWMPHYSLNVGIEKTVTWYKEQYENKQNCRANS